MGLRTNEEYIITDSVHIANSEFVLGVSTTSPNLFAIWECENGNCYFSGEYHNDLYSAQKDLVRRCQKEIERIDYNKRMAKTNKPKEKEFEL